MLSTRVWSALHRHTRKQQSTQETHSKACSLQKNTGFDVLPCISKHRILVLCATGISAGTLGVVWRLRKSRSIYFEMAPSIVSARNNLPFFEIPITEPSECLSVYSNISLHLKPSLKTENNFSTNICFMGILQISDSIRNPRKFLIHGKAFFYLCCPFPTLFYLRRS